MEMVVDVRATTPHVGKVPAANTATFKTIATQPTQYMETGDDSAAEAPANGDETDAESDAVVETNKGRPCPLCGASMHHRHCKYVCPEHGVVYDCSDTFY